ncbi:hypothetical protein ABK040_002052 [Willaertia magna]
MDLNSCAGGWSTLLENYDGLAKFCYDNQIADSTLKKYQTVYNYYSNFCFWNDLTVGEELSCVRFMSFVLAAGKGWILDSFKAAVTFFSLKDCFQFRWTDLMKGVKKGAKKIYNRIDKKSRLRDPFLLNAIHTWIDNMYTVTNWDYYTYYYCCLYAVIIVTGLRCLCRPKELVELSFDQIVLNIPEPSCVTIKSQFYKNDQFGKDTDGIPIEPIPNSPYCPVKIISAYRNLVLFKQPSDPFFSNLGSNEYLSTDFISSVIKIVNNTNAVVSGHSLRIGGASQLVKSGEPLEMVGFAGSWSSDAKNRYVRRTQLVTRKTSSKILTNNFCDKNQ